MRVVLVPTTTETLTVRTGLTTEVLSVTSTRYCVVSGTDSSANAKRALGVRELGVADVRERRP